MTQPLLEASRISKIYRVGHSPLPWQRRQLQAVHRVSLTVMAGETLGIVGESGCGKSTLGRCLMRLGDISEGTLAFAGVDITHLSQRRMRRIRRDMQMVFQDPAASLNGRRRIGDLLSDPFRIHEKLTRTEMDSRVRKLLVLVGLRPEHAARFPHEFSGGQKQRIGIARALALNPRLVIADEPVSALDVSIQAQIINLLCDLRERLGLTYIFIAHDLAVVRQIADRVAVMYLGEIVEIGSAQRLFNHPRHPYTAALRAAVPRPVVSEQGVERDRGLIESELPSPLDPPAGCRFHTRCPYATEQCRRVSPELRPDTGMTGDDKAHVACHFPLPA